jgi:valyl-tRNA synthetase
MPPPNITGKLHMGHALFLSIQDSLIRYWKNQNHDSLWIPGLDHAGLATYDKILEYQKENNCGYEEAKNLITESNKDTILDQMTKIGALPDWDKLTYTLDSSYQEFTLSTLKLFHEDNLISHDKGQFYINLSSLAEELTSDIENGMFNIIPGYEIKNLLPFIKNLEPWCISRQIPWGTPLPLFLAAGKIEFDENKPSPNCLDTWFNSSLWPIACLIKTPELIRDFYPASLIETGADILFFWCARMLMMGLYIYKNQQRLGLSIEEKYPFKSIYLHGIIRDKFKRKFSKTLGNGIDPLDMINKYGADATRLFLLTRTGPSEDIIFNENDLIHYKRFNNKIWQAARFFSIYAKKANMEKLDTNLTPLNSESRKIIMDYQTIFCSYMNNYKILESSRMIHSIFKEWFCDKWIESNKKQIQELNQETIKEGILIMDQMLAMLEPFCPFICNTIKEEFFL